MNPCPVPSSLFLISMTRIQFWILIAASSLVIVFLFLQALFAHLSQGSQGRIAAAQQLLQQGQSSDVRVRQLATTIYQAAQQSQDQQLKDLLSREGFVVQPPASDGSSAPSSTPAPH
jgi:hypothetical protein